MYIKEYEGLIISPSQLKNLHTYRDIDITKVFLKETYICYYTFGVPKM